MVNKTYEHYKSVNNSFSIRSEKGRILSPPKHVVYKPVKPDRSKYLTKLDQKEFDRGSIGSVLSYPSKKSINSNSSKYSNPVKQYNKY